MEPLFVPMDEAVSLNNVTSSYFLSSFHDYVRLLICYSYEVLLEYDEKTMQILVMLELLMVCPLV